MKTKCTIKEIGKRNKALDSNGNVIKTIPKPYVDIVNKSGFIDVRCEKMTLTEEERLLIILYEKTIKLRDIPNFKGLDEIHIEGKYHVKTTSGEEYYSIKIKDGPELKIKMSQWNKLNEKPVEIKRWA